MTQLWRPMKRYNYNDHHDFFKFSMDIHNSFLDMFSKIFMEFRYSIPFDPFLHS